MVSLLADMTPKKTMGTGLQTAAGIGQRCESGVQGGVVLDSQQVRLLFGFENMQD
jgi:hypothetical protein